MPPSLIFHTILRCLSQILKRLVAKINILVTLSFADPRSTDQFRTSRSVYADSSRQTAGGLA